MVRFAREASYRIGYILNFPAVNGVRSAEAHGLLTC